MLGQDDNERILGAHLERLGVKISWNTELVALTQHHDQVTATLRSASGEERIMRAAWVCGADGSRSAVRELNGIGFPASPINTLFSLPIRKQRVP
jgi:2-polyprenyl-6-methoxyphenol hydroxylase-like FAD-dependent oxidoreductase